MLRSACVLAFTLSFLSPLPLQAQLEPPSTGGLVALDHELRMLGHYRRVLMIGAHPDDEDTELLTILVRGMGAEAAYLSLNRGEGGQNLLGPELGEALGLIRTEELLAARRLDGARQYFTRAYDFGYSKSLEETWAHWPRDTVLKDVVRIVRRFRPQVIVSIFSGTPRDGHGQHQAAGWAAREAFTAAADSTRFEELEREEGLRAWMPLKLYRSTRFDTAATTLTLDGAILDPAVGKSFHQIAMAGRSLHRSQDMGQLQRIGTSAVRLELLEDRTAEGDGGIFAGIDTAFSAMPWRSAPAADDDATLRFPARIDSARAALGPLGLRRVAELLARARADLEPQRADSRAHVLFWTPEQTDQRAHLDLAAAIADGLLGDAVAGNARAVGGHPLPVTIEAWNAGGESLGVGVGMRAPAEWTVEGDTLTPDTLRPGALRTAQITLIPPARGAVTTPYFLRRPLRGAMYDWTGTAPRERGEPFEPPPTAHFVALKSGGRVTREVTFRANDQARGEVRRPVTVVPRVDVKLDPSSDVWSTLASTTRRFTVTLTHGGRDTTAGTVRLDLPTGWPAVPPKRFRFTREDERESFVFDVPVPRGIAVGAAEVRAVAQDRSGREYDVGVHSVDYPHIRPRSYAAAATALVRTAPLTLPPLARVGYVRGASDRVPQALRRVGVPIELLDGAALERGDLSGFDAIVIGPRAYETDSALVENNARLLDYVRAGGLAVVQYQQHRFFEGGFAPFPLSVGGPVLPAEPENEEIGSNGPSSPPARATVSHDRVTDETAPVRILATDHPVVLRPNSLDEGDWEDWVQERGLYFARTWDEAYRPILETHDSGEGPLEGGLLITRVGKGTYVYTGLSFFRQLPAGVPGAFRLFANLLALQPRRAR